MTIVESIKCVLQNNHSGLTSKQIYDEIIRRGLYIFGAENPVGVVNAQLRRRCAGLDFPTAYPVKFFEIAGYEDTSDLKDMVEKYPVEYRDCKAQIAGLLVASETRRRGIDMQSPKLEQVMLQYLSNNDTLLSEDGIKTLNAYALKGYRLITDYPLFDKPTSREEFLDAFNAAIQFYEKKDA